MGDRHSLGIALNKLGMAVFSQGRADEAVPYYQEAADIFERAGDFYNEVHSRRGLYESLWKTNPEEAKKHFDRFNELKDSIYSISSAESLAHYNAEFGNDWLMLENQAERRAKLWGIGVAVAIALLALGLGIWFHRKNRRQIQLNEKLLAVLEELKQEHQRESTPQEEGAADDFMQQVLTIIREQMGTGQLDVKTIAARMAMSPYLFRQELAKYTDETVQNLIRRTRMERACHLLQERRDLTIQEVAYLCGFSETANFTRMFKKTIGKTPTEFRGASWGEVWKYAKNSDSIGIYPPH